MEEGRGTKEERKEEDTTKEHGQQDNAKKTAENSAQLPKQRRISSVVGTMVDTPTSHLEGLRERGRKRKEKDMSCVGLLVRWQVVVKEWMVGWPARLIGHICMCLCMCEPVQRTTSP